MYYYDIIHRGKYGSIEEVVHLTNVTEYSQNEFNLLVKAIRKEAYDSQTGKREKWIAFDYTIKKLEELGFKRKVIFDF